MVDGIEEDNLLVGAHTMKNQGILSIHFQERDKKIKVKQNNDHIKFNHMEANTPTSSTDTKTSVENIDSREKENKERKKEKTLGNNRNEQEKNNNLMQNLKN